MTFWWRGGGAVRPPPKVIEIAPAPNLNENIRQALYADAVKFAKALNYQNAGTVEFLVEPWANAPGSTCSSR